MNSTVTITIPSSERELVNAAKVSFGGKFLDDAQKVVVIVTGTVGLFKTLMEMKKDQQKKGKSVEEVTIAGASGETVSLEDLDDDSWNSRIMEATLTGLL